MGLLNLIAPKREEDVNFKSFRFSEHSEKPQTRNTYETLLSTTMCQRWLEATQPADTQILAKQTNQTCRGRRYECFMSWVILKVCSVLETRAQVMERNPGGMGPLSCTSAIQCTNPRRKPVGWENPPGHLPRSQMMEMNNANAFS